MFWLVWLFFLQGDSSKKGIPPKRRFATIDHFFSKKSRLDPVGIVESSSSPPSTSHDGANVAEVTKINEDYAPSAVSNDQRNNLSTQTHFSSDIGCYLERQIIDDFTKAMLLERHWTPTSNYNFPYSVVTKNGKETKKYAQRSHLEKFHWLVLSHKDQGLYCKYCFLFVSGLGGSYQPNTLLGRLVKAPLKVFDDLLGEKGALLKHKRNQYHQKLLKQERTFFVITTNQNLKLQIKSARNEKIK